jgi:hypothetical protein
LLLLIVLSAAGVTWFTRRNVSLTVTDQRRSWGEIGSWIGTVLGGLLLVPGILIGFYASQGALHEMYYCVIQHNTLPGEHTPGHLLKQLLFSPSTLAFIPALLLGVTTIPEIRRNPARGTRRLFLFLLCGFFYPLLHGLWAHITPQDNIPWFPLVFITATPGLIWLGDFAARRLGANFPRVIVPLVVLGAGLVWIRVTASPFQCETADGIARIGEALRLTNPGDYIMDPKGDMIFRRRPYYYVLETLTRKRVLHKLIADDLPEQLIQTKTAVVMESQRMTARALEFVSANYLAVGDLSVAGKALKAGENGTFRFEIAVPQRYSFIDRHGPLTGTLDGKPVESSQWIEAGSHVLQIAGQASEPAVLWSQAVERGFRPVK